MARFALAALGAVLGLLAIGLALREPDALTLPGPVHVAIGWSFVAAGAVAWRERPENRMGLLMTLTGIAWFGRDLDWFDSTVAEHASELSLNVFLALVAHQLVVFPEGTARSRRERLLVFAIYGLAVLAYAPSELSDTANSILSALGIVLAVLVLFVIVKRWLEADARERRALRPLIVLGPPVVVVAAASLAHDYIGIDLSSAGEEALRWCALVFAGLPVAFLIGVLRTHLRRAILGRLLADLSRGTLYEDAALEEAAAAARRALRSGAPLPRLDELTPRELEVLALLAEGRTDRGIAKELYVTPKTVEAHVRSIFRKLDLPREETENRRVHAVLTFLGAARPEHVARQSGE
jgi:DNA-binding NarL/FixJ family response regulator